MQLLEHRGFGRRWRGWLAALLLTCSTKVLVNGELSPRIDHRRGFRQGDPISPYLFLITGEGLSCLLKSVPQSSAFSGVQVAPTAPVVNHLLLANDILMLYKASTEGAVVVSNLLDTYCNASGQKVNNEKSSIFFSKGWD